MSRTPGLALIESNMQTIAGLIQRVLYSLSMTILLACVIGQVVSLCPTPYVVG